jgi:hypothetical protein
MTDPQPLHDPTFFPIGYDAATDTFRFTRTDLATVGDAAFLDDRAPLGWNDATPLSMQQIADAPAPASAPSWLFHTAFCASTLLARALHAPPRAVALKEPKILLDLSHAAIQPNGPQGLDLRFRLAAAIALLARPWADGGRVLIKPTNQVDRLLPDILALNPGMRAVLLYSSLEEFLLSCCKKLPEAETRIRWMAQHLLVGSRLAARLGIAPLHPFNFVESCVLTWYAQIERYADGLAADTGDNLRTLDMRSLMREREGTVRACATFLRLDGALEGLDERVLTEFARDAKTTTRAFSPEQRDREKAVLREHYAPLVAAALEWANEAVAPSAVLPADWKPLRI